MAIKIKLEKTFCKGVKGYVFLGGDALKKEKLPSKYFQGRPHLYAEETIKGKNRLVLLKAPAGSVVLYPDRFFKEEEMEEILQEISKAGKRLQKVNDKIREEKKTWHGEVEIII